MIMIGVKRNNVRHSTVTAPKPLLDKRACVIGYGHCVQPTRTQKTYTIRLSFGI